MSQMTSHDKPPPAEWRWDRFDSRKMTTVTWAKRNCVGADRELLVAHLVMQQKVLQEQKKAEQIILSEIHQLMYDAASITGMTYYCKLTHHTIVCTNTKDMRRS